MALLGNGCTLTLATTGVSLEITSMQSGNITWAYQPTSHLGTTGGHTFLRSSIYDPGDITVQFIVDPDDNDTLLSNSSAETVTITYNDSPAATEAASGFVTQFDPATFEVDGVIMGSLTLKRSGTLTFADGT